MPEMHLRQPRYSTFGPFTKHKKRIQKFKKTGDSRYIYQNELDKAYFQNDMAYGDFKNFTRRTASDKILHDKAFNIIKNPKQDGYQRGLPSMVYRFFDEKTFATHANKFPGNDIKNKNMSDQKLAEKLHKPIIKRFKKKKCSHLL